MASVTTISSPIWGISTYGYGVIVEGVSAIRQRMDLAIRTTKGTDPLRPEFGSNVYKYVDAPDNIAVPNIKKEILDALDIWVKDVKVLSIKSYLKALGNPVFEITFRLVDDTLTQSLIYDAKAGVFTSNAIAEIIVQASFPDNPNGLRYQFNFQKNGATVAPLQPAGGFGSINEMFAFMQANYSYLGKWYLLADKIVCYMNATGVQSASLAISVITNETVFIADFPVLDIGQNYQVLFTPMGVPLASPLFITPGEALAWVRSNWGDYATWDIQYIATEAGAFSDAFSDEFFVDVTGYKLIGLNQSGLIATLNIISA